MKKREKLPEGLGLDLKLTEKFINEASKEPFSLSIEKKKNKMAHVEVNGKGLAVLIGMIAVQKELAKESGLDFETFIDVYSTLAKMLEKNGTFTMQEV